MYKKLLKNINYIAIFLLGLTSTICIHIAQIAMGYIRSPEDSGDIVSGIINSMPYNIISLSIFLCSLVYIIWHSGKQARDDEINKQRDIKILVQRIKEAITESTKESNREAKAN